MQRLIYNSGGKKIIENVFSKTWNTRPQLQSTQKESGNIKNPEIIKNGKKHKSKFFFSLDELIDSATSSYF